MKKFLCFVLISLCFSAATLGQKKWSEWDKKEVEKMLNSSAWGQTQAETDTAEMTANIGSGGYSATNQAMTFNYRVRFFSAKPIREAFARQVMFANPKLIPSQLENFVNGDYSESIVVSIAWDGADRRYTSIISEAFAGKTTDSVVSKVYLERKDGKQLTITEYSPPSSDGTGAKFVFPRLLNGKPFIESGDDFIRFVADMGKGVKVNWRFKVSDMNYNGKLEY